MLCLASKILHDVYVARDVKSGQQQRVRCGLGVKWIHVKVGICYGFRFSSNTAITGKLTGLLCQVV